MNINKFTQNSLQAVQNCEKIAMDYGNQELAQEHLLYALLTQDDSLIAKLMEKMGLDKNMVINRVEESLRKLPKVQGGQQYVGQALNNVLVHAEDEAKQMGDEYVKQEPLNVLKLTGAATSMYMVNYWGHDENLMYYIDHQYPLMAAGWGSTADYILLKDVMTINVAMFSDWSF